MAPHSSILAWKIPWMEESGGLQSIGLLKVRHDWATSLSLSTFMCWRRKWQPTPVFLPGESQGRGAWWAAVYGVTQSQTRLKQLSSSSNRVFSISIGSWEETKVFILWLVLKRNKMTFIKQFFFLLTFKNSYALSRKFNPYVFKSFALNSSHVW